MSLTSTTLSFNSPSSLAQLTTAAKALQEALSADMEGLEDMLAVSERLNEFREYRRLFSVRLRNHLEATIEMLVDSCLGVLKESGGGLAEGGDPMTFVGASSTHSLIKKIKVTMHDVTVHNRLLPMSSLTEWMKAMDPQMLVAIQDVRFISSVVAFCAVLYFDSNTILFFVHANSWLCVALCEADEPHLQATGQGTG